HAYHQGYDSVSVQTAVKALAQKASKQAGAIVANVMEKQGRKKCSLQWRPFASGISNFIHTLLPRVPKQI
ncbi:MAG: hypothetical protein ACPIOQ_40565, partial [Promethearchaeia archaeon]